MVPRIEDDEPTETLKLAYGKIGIELTASPEDMKWLRPLFTRNANPFRVLHQLGYRPVDPRDNDE